MPLEGINKDILPEYCPMKISEETLKSVIEKFGTDDVKRLYLPAAITEKEAYESIRGACMAVQPRITELMLFAMNSKAPVTTLIVKDRLPDHNSVIALYSNYHKDIFESQKRTKSKGVLENLQKELLKK
jgi:hypothetical protein